MSVDAWVEQVKDCAYLPENDLKVSAGARKKNAVDG